MCVISGLVLGGIGTALASTVGASVAYATGALGTLAISATSTATVGAAVLDAGLLAVGTTLAGGITGMVSGIQNAEAQQRQAEFQQEMEEENARLAYRHAENIEVAANQKRAALLRESQQNLGAGRAGYAANGVVLGSGTAAEYEADVANAYDLDLRNLNYDTASERWQSQVSGNNARNQAAQYGAMARGYASQKVTTGIGGALSLAGKTASTAFNYGTGLLRIAG